MAPVASIKVEFNGELRRFISPSPTITFAELSSRVRALFSIKDSDTPALSYRDEDGDLVRISSDDELLLALRLHAEGVITGTTLRIFANQRGLLPTSPAKVKKTVCKNQAKARFVKDVTVEKGQVIEPGATFTKVWRFRNEGTTSWGRGTRLMYLPKNSDSLNGPMTVPLAVNEVKVGQEVDVAVDLTAPTKAGRYVAYYRLYDPARDKKFGQRVWVEILVVSGSSSSEADLSWQLVDNEKDGKKKKRKVKPKKASASSSEGETV